MKKIIVVLIYLIVVVSGFVWANLAIKNEPIQKSSLKTISPADRKTAMEKWNATPEGIKFNKWKASSEGLRVVDDAAKISPQIKSFTDIEAVVTSLSLPIGSRLGYGIMVRINEADYILSFGVEDSDEFRQLRSLKVNDQIVLRSHSVSYAPKYAFPIIKGDYVEKDQKTLFIRVPKTDGC